MTSALGFDARVGAPRRVPLLSIGDRYSIVGKLKGTGRAEVSFALPASRRSVEELIVIKTYGSGPQGSALLPLEIPAEVEVASTPRHENLVRVVECGWDAGGHFIVSEYLEGTTLRRLLRWLAVRDQKLPNAAVARILLGMFAAVEHANQWSRKPEVRALVHQPIDASDVFITYAGAIKVLGFKPQRSRDSAGSGVAPIERAAVDELLSNQRSPELAAALARIGNRVSAASLIGLWQVARMLREWQHEQLQSDGRAELAEVMATVQPEGRAQLRSQLEAAVARVVRVREEAEPAADAPPASGYRAASASEALAALPMAPSVGREPREPELPLPGLMVRAPQVVSPLQRVPLLSPQLSGQQASAAQICTPQALAPLGPELPSHAMPLPVRRARRRGMPWASLVVLAGVLAAGLVVIRHPGTRVEAAHAPAIAASHAREAPDALAESNPAPGTARGTLVESQLTASERAPERARASRDDVPSKPAGAAARVSTTAEASPGSQRRNAREGRLGDAVPGARGPAASVAPGFLTLDTTPWSAVSVQGVALGQTPLVRVELAPGQHTVELANEELGIATSIVVEITSGSTTVRRIGLEQPVHAARR